MTRIIIKVSDNNEVTVIIDSDDPIEVEDASEAATIYRPTLSENGVEHV